MIYHAVTVTLENITGITAGSDMYCLRTTSLTFNVTVSGKRQYAVVLLGAPRLENGTVVTAILRNPENWQTLVAWLNHSTGEICGIDSPGELFARFMFASIMGVLFVLKAMDADSSMAFAIVMLCTAVVITAWSFGTWLRSFKVYRMLKP